jgi:hypothetical protein
MYGVFVILATIAADKPATVVGVSAAEARRRVEQIAASAKWDDQAPILDAVMTALSPSQPRLEQLTAQVRADVWSAPGWLFDPSVDEFLRSQSMLYAGRELSRTQHYDEALVLLSSLKGSQVVDPATLFFYRAVCEHALHRKDDALASLELLEALTEVPNRYRTVARRLKERLDRLERESLAGVAHDMRDIRRRMEIRKADAQALALEKDVVARLDKMIDQAEKQRNSQQGSGGSSNSPSGPAPDSRPMGGKGEGKVDARTFKDQGGWGNLPDKERERALQDLGRDFPPHYRDAVEQYFRRLAGSKERK